MTLETQKQDADKRTAAHKGQSSQRVLNKDHDEIGIAGEEAFGELIGQKYDGECYEGRGDNGIDFIVKIPFNVDVKTSSSEYLGLLVEQGTMKETQMFVLAIKEPDDVKARCVGWCWRREVEEVQAKPWPKKIVNHCLSIGDLRPMNDLVRRLSPPRVE
jgi:hypothetical protein